MRDYGPGFPSTDQLYVPYAQGGFVQWVLLRVEGDPKSAIAALKEEVWALGPEQPVTEVATLDTVVLLLVTAGACLIPAQRAAEVDPTVALRRVTWVLRSESPDL